MTKIYFSVDDVIAVLDKHIKRHGGPTKAAVALGIDPAAVSKARRDKPLRALTPTLLAALGFEARTVFVFKRPNDA